MQLPPYPQKKYTTFYSFHNALNTKKQQDVKQVQIAYKLHKIPISKGEIFNREFPTEEIRIQIEK